MANVKKLDPNKPTQESPQLLDANAEVHNGVQKITPNKPADGGVVKEIIYPDMNSGLEEGVDMTPPSTEPGEIEEPIDSPFSQPDDGTNIPTETVSSDGTVSVPTATPQATSNGGNDRQLKNADINFSQYGDDSSAPNQATAGGQNEKYTGEGVKTSNVNYNPNATIEGLNPNYQYGMDAQWANSASAGYIARRNDEIASALYNAGLTSKDDVINFLAQQKGWNNSTEADRVNTVESIWKRLGQIVEENPQSDGATPEGDNSPSGAGNDATNNDAVSKMEEDLLGSTAGELFGKWGADKDGRIKTLEDANSVFKSMNESRIRKLKELQSMSSEKMAFLISEGMNSFSEQSMRDLMQYDPAKYQEIQDWIKKIKGQEDIDQISTTGKIDITGQLDKGIDNINSEMNGFIESTASTRDALELSTNLSNALSESEIVNTARGQMEVYKRKIQEIQDEADGLEAKARAYFKSDVPQYLVNAFIANRMQQYNKELQKYQNLYNATLEEAKMEISQTQWREEMNYKWANLQADQNYKDANLALSYQEYLLNQQKAEIANGQWNDDGTYSYVGLDGQAHTLDPQKANNLLNRDLYEKSTSFIDYWKNKIEKAKATGGEIIGPQCEVLTDNYANQYWGVTMVAEDGSAVTTAERKAAYATEALPQRGYIAVWNYKTGSANSIKYGHTGIVIDYDPTTGKFTTLESNAKKNKNGMPVVSIEEHSINDANLQGFRDPTKGDTTKNPTSSVMDEYMQLPNGMLDVFIKAEENANGVEAQKYVRQGREGYGILNMMLNNGEIRAMIDGDDAATAFDKFNKYLVENASNRKIVDEDGNFFVDTVLQAMLNSGTNISGKERDALRHLYRLVQIKLRRDSGAAINIGEWMGDFNMYLPQIGMSKKQKMQGLFDLERAAIESAMPGEYVKQYVPIITFERVNAEEDKNLDEEVEDILNGQ